MLLATWLGKTVKPFGPQLSEELGSSGIGHLSVGFKFLAAVGGYCFL